MQSLLPRLLKVLPWPTTPIPSQFTVGGQVQSAPNVAFQPACACGGRGTIKECSDCLPTNSFIDATPGSKKDCGVGRTDVPTLCIRPASVACQSRWPKQSKPFVANSWTETPVTTAICGQQAQCAGISGPGTLRCRGSASDWLQPYMAPNPDPASAEHEALVIANLEEYKKWYSLDDEGKRGFWDMIDAFCTSKDASGLCAPTFKGMAGAGTDCPRVSRTSKAGSACRRWLQEMVESGDSKAVAFHDSLVRNYCAKNPDSPYCLCTNRTQNPDFARVKSELQAPDHCWFAPCVAPEQLLLSADIEAKTSDAGKCPDVCKQVREIQETSVGGSAVFAQELYCPGSDASGGVNWTLVLIISALALVLIVLIVFVAKRVQK